MATTHQTASRIDRPAGTRLLVQLTDCHIRADAGFTYDGIDTRESLQEVVALMRARHGLPDAVALTGDLSDDGSQAAYAWLRGCLTTLAVPAYCIPGNHDDAEVLRAVLPGDNVHVTDWAELGGWQLVLLSSAVAGREGGSLGRGGQDTLSGLLRFAGHAPTLVLLAPSPGPGRQPVAGHHVPRRRRGVFRGHRPPPERPGPWSSVISIRPTMRRVERCVYSAPPRPAPSSRPGPNAT